MRVVALVTEIEEEGKKDLIAGCRYVAMDENDPPKLAEVAFTVVDTWQGKGLGKLLFKHLADIGRSLKLERFEAFVLPENRGMINVFTSTGLNVHPKREGGDIYFEIEL